MAYFRFLTARAVLSALLAAGGAALAVPGVASATSGTVSGTVFRDYNADGIRQPGELGQPGVTVEAFDKLGASLGRVATDQTGTYLLTVSAPTGVEVRVEFQLPTGSFLRPGVQLPTGATNVQFVPVGAVDVEWSVQNPTDYCGSLADARLVTNCWKLGDQSNTNKVIGSWKYPANDYDGATMLGADQHNARFDGEADGNQVGTTYGLGYNRSSGTLFAGAYYRRFAGLAERRTGAVWEIRNAGTANPQTSSTPWLDLNDLFGAGTAGVDLHPTVPSPPASAANSQSPEALAWLHDGGSWAAVSKTALGDVEVTEDNKYLFVVNLADRQLYRASAQTRPATSSDVQRVPIVTAPNCATEDSRPFGLGFNDGVGYVGVVCSAESTFAALPGIKALVAAAEVATAHKYRRPAGMSEAAAQLAYDTAWATLFTAAKPALDQLRAYVYVFSPDPMPTSRADFTLAMDVPLNYERSSHEDAWLPWTDDFDMTVNREQNVYEQRWHEPLLSSIAFGPNTMYIGLRNRFGDRTSFHGGHPDFDHEEIVSGKPTKHFTYNQQYGARGAVLRACRSTGGTWILESDGICDGVLGTGVGPGPGGGLFYGAASEFSMGAIVHPTGASDIAATMMDPTIVFSNGTSKFLAGGMTMNERRGGRSAIAGNAFTVYFSPFGPRDRPDTFGKSNGLGDLEILCDGSPIEVGDRVWSDANDNGRQDPEEPGIAGVNVDVVSSSGGVVGSAVTGPNGAFLFSSIARPGAVTVAQLSPRNPAHIGLRLRVRHNQPALTGLNPKGTDPTVGASRDSDFVPLPGVVNESFTDELDLDNTTLGPVFHDIDLGFGLTPLPRITAYAVQGEAWRDVIHDAVRGAGDMPGKLMIELIDTATNLVKRTTIAPVTSYQFDKLPAGTYRIRFSELPSGEMWSNCHVVANTDVDSDACYVTGSIATSDPIVLDIALDPTVSAVTPADGAVVADYIVRHVDAAYFLPISAQAGTT
jgi:SdrD B-like domain